jgi:hypothetical protein
MLSLAVADCAGDETELPSAREHATNTDTDSKAINKIMALFIFLTPCLCIVPFYGPVKDIKLQ